MKMLKRLMKWIYSPVFAGAEPDLTPSSYYPTVHTPISRRADYPDDYIAGLPRRAHPMETLHGFQSRPTVEAKHCWHPPEPYRLPVND
ncbi:MAG TPA: hypothetical protein VKV37_02415 [Ktedonobacteraceae bacterium]|nr:hypothetical protein [Ktedonobacteraceae bacterium]